MKGEVTTETTIAAPAEAVWAAYRGKELGLIVDKLARDVIGKVEFLEGDGGVGTLIKLTFPPGTPGVGYLKEVIKVNDDEKRVKVTEVIEGGYKALGFDLCHIKLEILEKDPTSSSIVRSTIEYELDDSLVDLASHVNADVFEVIAQTVSRHLLETN